MNANERIKELVRQRDSARAAVQLAVDIMAMLEVHPGMVGHYIDTDDNDGEYFRRAADELGIVASDRINEQIAAIGEWSS